MPICVKDIMSLDSLKKLELVAGGDGLEKIIEWTYVAECFENPLEGIQWIQGGELVFISGLGIKSDVSGLIKLIEGINKRNGVGLIVNVGKYIRSIPDEAIKIAEQLGFPLFTLPWEVKFVEVTKDISNAIILSRIEENSLNQFMNNILFGDCMLEADPIKKATYFGYDIKGKCYVSLVKIGGIKEYLKLNNILYEKNIKKIKIKCRKIIRDTIRENGLRLLIIDKDNQTFIINKSEESFNYKLELCLKQIQNVINKEFDGLLVSIGIGNCYDEINMLKQSLKEAQIAVESAECQEVANSITKYSKIGIFGLLFGIDNKEVLQNYYKNVLGYIDEGDCKSKEVSSLKILETYLNENCSITNTADKLLIHRNTLKYRIKKIEKTLDCDLHDFDDCIKLRMAFYVNKIL